MLTPQPPLDMLVDPTVDLRINLIVGSFALIALIFSLVHWAKSKRPTVLMLFFAGGSMAVFEPMVDTVGACWFPINSLTAFTAWGRPLPVWLVLSYFFYFGIGVSAMWIAMTRGVTRGQVWMMFIAGIFGDLIFEKTLLLYDPYIYYGWQPLLWGKFPLWWAPVNALVPLLAAAAVYRMAPLLQGWRIVLIVPIGLTASAVANAAAGWPSWTVINTDVGFVWTQVGGLLSVALAFWFTSLIAMAVATRDVPGKAAKPAFATA